MTGLFGWAYLFSDFGGIVEAWSAHLLFGALFSLGWVVLGCLFWLESAKRHTSDDEGNATSEHLP